MKKFKSLIALFIMLVSTSAFAADTYAAPILRGYDAVSYHTMGKPVMGKGTQVSEYKGQVYLFATEDNKDTFNKNPEKYTPAYGGWCAFGVSAGKKFQGDPLVWEIVDGKLYVNLNKKIQKLWVEDIPKHIKEADTLWKDIKNKPASSL